ncbi:hypothetical protein BC833DRAFT_646840 [Globomyces pollinis-pini]|nr:hypothetical protein BC833DRAFT_646840 [Globomyces pollinis-pini]
MNLHAQLHPPVFKKFPRLLYLQSQPDAKLTKLVHLVIKKGTYAKRYGESCPSDQNITPALEETEKLILKTLDDLKQEKRKIFSQIALNMKKKNEKVKQQMVKRENAKAKQAMMSPKPPLDVQQL